MGKKQHSKDRMFITKTEWATEWGGAKSRETRTPFKRLPYYCCALAFTPFETPVCTIDGSVFDIMNIMPYIRKYGKHPVTGAPLKLEDLIALTFHKNAEGEYHCPVLNKVFTEFTHIVAVKTTGNVFCYEAIKELNIKTKNWKELLTDETFAKEDLITIQNPNALDIRVTLEFDHVKHSLKVDDEELKKMSSDPGYNINITGDIQQMLQELGTEKGRQTALLGGGGSKAQNERAAALAAILEARSRIKEGPNSDSKGEAKAQQAFSIVDAASASVHGRSAAAAKAAPTDKTAARIAMHMAGERMPVNAKMVKSRFSSGAASRSFTSTSFDPVTKNEFEYIKVEKNPKKKGYVQLHTTHGDLNIELHCDITPRTCENFISLCERGYYNGVAFHRSIRNFMIQGGDPTGTGRGGESIWGKSFKDELNSKLLHSGRGVVSMANSGPHTNGSQFFILYKSANHLNFKHTVFGGVVGGLTTLAAMEKVPVDDDDRPLEEIKINSVTVFVNPYSEPDEEEEEDEEKTKNEKKIDDEENDKVGSWYSNPGTGTTESGSLGGVGVGKYLKARNAPAGSGPITNAIDTSLATNATSKKRKVGISTGEFKNFSAW
ncbi:peptidyl-prolyl cis-trans isomerase CYP65 [Carica papaya]|uniref:peptidyl-prolyl cis-trans isomerase CYP65 n=1 Tax=Carica papaya TaxID=3649 RepID=UPI000B8C7956|nr:peptidyl-prolyl cis-trans isomerase CYP65 [Carica papaya]